MVVEQAELQLVLLALPRKLQVASLLALPLELTLALPHCVPLIEAQALVLRVTLALEELEGLRAALLVTLALKE